MSTCPDCNGTGKMVCDNPDHGLIEATGGETARLGCPCCGHDPDYLTDCDLCMGTGVVVSGKKFDRLKAEVERLSDERDDYVADIATLSQENAELKQREDIWVEMAAKNARLLSENAALRAEVKGLQFEVNRLTKISEGTASLRAELAKYKEALEWYGDEKNYVFVSIVNCKILEDGGQRAREAVGK